MLTTLLRARTEQSGYAEPFAGDLGIPFPCRPGATGMPRVASLTDQSRIGSEATDTGRGKREGAAPWRRKYAA
ncbi:hypothetical protein GCM10010421_36560 [Streptomyces glaucus]|uniref:Secreted protein n=1 Tax=Streptomyces glaucus TaxID=284029 RepID=A0ABP5X1A4_9ACTN